MIVIAAPTIFSILSSTRGYPPTTAIFDSARIQSATVVLVRERASLDLSLRFMIQLETSESRMGISACPSIRLRLSIIFALNALLILGTRRAALRNFFEDCTTAFDHSQT